MTYSRWAVSLSLLLSACSSAEPGVLGDVGGAAPTLVAGQAGGDASAGEAGASSAGAEGGSRSLVADSEGGDGSGELGAGGVTTNDPPRGGSTGSPGGSGGHGGLGGHGGAVSGGPTSTGGTSVAGVGAGGSGTAGMGGSGGSGMGGSQGAHEPALPGSDGLIYGQGGGSNYLAGIEIQCQKPNPKLPWKYGEPHFEIRSPIDHSILASKIPCGGRAWDLNLSWRYIVLGYEGDELCVSTGFLPGSVVTIVMP